VNAAMLPEPKIVSLRVGRPTNLPVSQSSDSNKTWTTGFFKKAAAGQVWLGTLNLAGDGQADLVHHGGANKAVCAFSADHFSFWSHKLNRLDFQIGAFGENFAITGLAERDVCIGDIWEVGEALVQVSQPRQPCWKLARRWNVRDLALQVQQTGRTGWYFRVLREGFVANGMPLSLVERQLAEWTVEKANHIMHHDKENFAEAARLAAIRPLSSSWRDSLLRRIQLIDESGDLRLNGTINPTLRENDTKD